MLKKVALSIIVIGLSTGLVIGAINRTSDKSNQPSVLSEHSRKSESEGPGSSGETVSSGYQRGQGLGSRSDSEMLRLSSLTSLSNDKGRNGVSVFSDENEFTEQTGTFQAEGKDWVTLDSTVGQISSEDLILLLSNGEQFVIEGRAWRYALEAGFLTEVDHQISVTGFFEDGEFKISTIIDLTTNQSITLRQDSGRPLWAAGGRRGT
jgi:hypothetical protein